MNRRFRNVARRLCVVPIGSHDRVLAGTDVVEDLGEALQRWVVADGGKNAACANHLNEAVVGQVLVGVRP
jgi:hypothetical protein